MDHRSSTAAWKLHGVRAVGSLSATAGMRSFGPEFYGQTAVRSNFSGQTGFEGLLTGRLERTGDRPHLRFKLGIGHGFVQHFGAPEWRILVGVELFGHTAATLALGAGVPAKVVSEQLGHASVAFTLDTYSHVLPHMQEAAAAQMEVLLFEAAPKKRAARKTKRTTTHRRKREHKMKASSK